MASLVTDQLSTSGRPSTQPPSSYASAAASTDPIKQRQSCLAVSPEKKRDDYWRCRKALRLRLVGQGDTHTKVRKFMTEHLKLDSQFMESIGPFTAMRVPGGPAAKIRGEVIVSFQSVDVRDAVKGSARNLAGKGRDYGVRLELPNHLKSAMKALQSASFEIKSRFGEARRNVLFDDETMDLVLDFSIGEGKPWKRMSSAQAIERKKRRPSDGLNKVALRDGEIDDLLDSAGSGNDLICG